MIVHCDRCGGGKEVTTSRLDRFIWQCPLCCKRYVHEPEIPPIEEKEEEIGVGISAIISEEDNNVGEYETTREGRPKENRRRNIIS